MLSKRNRALVRKFGGHVMPFRSLPTPAKLAIAWYMAINGEAWDLAPEFPSGEIDAKEFQRAFKRTLPFYVKKYGSKRIGYVEIPTEALMDAVMHTEGLSSSFETFQDYHRWYVGQGHMPDHPPQSRWPVILSEFEEETLQDGWHRFHHYVDQGARVIPAVYYP